MSQKQKWFFLDQSIKDFSLKTTLNRIRVYETNSVKYVDNKLNWKAHIDDNALKLIRANALLYKVTDFVK